jgi:serine/threonine-protein kinase RsbW
MTVKQEDIKVYKLVLASEVENVEKVEELTERISKRMKFSEDECDSIAIAVTEAVNNAIIHGNKQDPKKKVYLNISVGNNTLKVIVKDEGKGFNPENLPDPLDPENLLKESGRGIFILKSLMDEVSFEFSKNGTILTLTKHKSD